MILLEYDIFISNDNIAINIDTLWEYNNLKQFTKI